MTAKVLLLTNIPNPYRLPLFNELNRQLRSEGISLKVVFGAPGYSRRKFQIDMNECEFHYHVLESDAIRYGDTEKVSFTYKNLLKIVARERPDLIIANGFSMATMKIWARSWISKTPFLIWSGAIHHPMDPVSPLRKIQRRLLLRRSAGCIAYGSLARDYLASLGMSPQKIEIGINTVDTEFFKTETEKYRGGERRSGTIKNLLCVSYLTTRKRIDQLLLLVQRLSRQPADFKLTILGDGPEKSALQDMAMRLGLERYVEFRGFVQKTDIPPYLASADCYLFPTDYDIWGLVLVEAMAAGSTCIASINAGAVRDLVENGVTGFAMDFSDTEALAERVIWILDHEAEAATIGRNARQFIERNATLAQSAQGFTRAILNTLEAGGRGALDRIPSPPSDYRQNTD